jgi:hypothetical protein
MIFRGFSTILGGVNLKLVAVSPTLFRGGPAHERRKDAVFAAGIPYQSDDLARIDDL